MIELKSVYVRPNLREFNNPHHLSNFHMGLIPNLFYRVFSYFVLD